MNHTSILVVQLIIIYTVITIYSSCNKTRLVDRNCLFSLTRFINVWPPLNPNPTPSTNPNPDPKPSHNPNPLKQTLALTLMSEKRQFPE